MSEEREVLVRELLERLEGEEAKLLSWGVVDGGFTSDEVTDFVRDTIVSRGAECDERVLLQELIDRKLLFAFRDGFTDLFRTRVGEAIRLFSRLRQLFPNRQWQFAPTLVADYRFDRRPRRYPRRELLPATVIERLRAEVRLSPLEQQALTALLREGAASPLQLAEFQFQAARRLFLDLRGRSSRGIIIGAGTGTGKTLAFYVPALTHLASLIDRDSHWTKAIAIYPRNELLKDQFAETYAEARRLDDTLLRSAGRKLTIGTFFGPTPYTAASLKSYKSWGEVTGGGYVCPFIRCPRCNGDLLWLATDVDRNHEALHCRERRCGTVLPGDEVLLTRARISASPPDVLFTTTETLNRQMGSSLNGHIFGLGQTARRPQIVLLDEVHTYSGVTGAQVALLLRRWRHALGSRVQFVGLSATLRGAGEFFGELVGLKPGFVEEVSPKDAELDPVPEGVGYVLALRGDPVSGANLLSTSIQAAMLLRRVLDGPVPSPSRGMFGRRVFAFTDDLDVTNRLYHNLLNAEGYDPNQDPPRPTEPVLAALRSTVMPDNAMRLPFGQSWQLCEDIGHNLGARIRVSRTSSQDTGVTEGSDVVVATASLEVGYNDPEVGAVLQHKAPRDWAAYLQRKGRAGRSRTMRPWTVVVLSDYGRDRIAYQAYDQFFDPELPHRSLPIGNRYVLRMQAAFALMDWVARELPQGTPRGSVWADFSGPPDGARTAEARERQRVERVILAEILDGVPERCRSLEGYVQAALGLTADVAQSILWDPPRPLLLSVVPTLLRRLETGWRRVPAEPNEPAKDYLHNDHPLPDFVPQQLFGDLNLPEVEVLTDPSRADAQPESFFLPVLQAIRILAPGRVTRRFGYKVAFASHWVPLPNLQQRDQVLAVEDLCERYDEAGSFQVIEHGQVQMIRCVRPWRIHPHQVPPRVAPSSNATIDWRSQIAPSREDERLRFEPPTGTGWERLLDTLSFYTHSQRNHATVRRFAVGSQANVLFRDGTQFDASVQFVNRGDGNPAAVGFTQESDAIAFRFRIPPDLGLGLDHPNRRKLRAFRTAYFRNAVKDDGALGRVANLFQRDWLAQIYLSAVASSALTRNVPFDAAERDLHAGDLMGVLDAVLLTIFQTVELPNGQQAPQRVRDDLQALLHDRAVTDALRRLARALWADPDDEWLRWAAERYKATLGGALLEACIQSCPQLEVGDLYLDLDPGPRPPDAPPLPDGISEVWVTESTIGGGGIVEEVLRSFVSDPRRFFRIAESALSATDFEIVDRELTRLLELSKSDGEVRGALAAVRGAENHADLLRTARDLRRLLSRRGIVVTHSVMSALHARLLRPGSSPQTDELLRLLVRGWNRAEEALGVELDARIYAYLASLDPTVHGHLGALGGVPLNDPFWCFQAVYGLLWPRGYQVRGHGLTSYNPFSDGVPPDREILLDLLRRNEPVIQLGPALMSEAGRLLSAHGSAKLSAQMEERRALKEAILQMVVSPVEVGYLHLYPSLAGLTQGPDGLSATLDLREVLP